MTAIQQQRLIGAILVALLVAVLAWLVLTAVDSHDAGTVSDEEDEPIVFDSVVEPIKEGILVNDVEDNSDDDNSERAADDLVELPEQTEAKVVIPEQAVEDESSADEEIATDTVKNAETSDSDDLTALAKQLESEAEQPASESESQQQKSAETEKTESRQQEAANPEKPESNDASDKNADAVTQTKQWVIQLGSFSKRENAEGLVRRLQEADYDAVVEEAEIDGRTIYRVRLRADDDRDRVEDIAKELSDSMELKPQILTHTP